MWPSLLCAPHHLILTEELELLDGRSPSGPTCVLLRPATRSEASIKEISVRSGQVCPWHQHLLFRETAHLLHRGEGPPNTPPCRSSSSPFSLVGCSCYLFWDEAGGQGGRENGEEERGNKSCFPLRRLSLAFMGVWRWVLPHHTSLY